MQPMMRRSAMAALRTPALRSSIPRASNAIPRRAYANQTVEETHPKDTSGSPAPAVPAGGSKFLMMIADRNSFAIGGVVIAVVGGRYIFASNKPARSGNKAYEEARAQGQVSNRDPRDSPVKTLEQKKQKEQSS